MVAAVSASIAPLLPAGMAPLFAADFTSAALASLLVTPLVAAVDKAIVQLASGSTPSVGASVVASLASMAKSPLSFARRPEFMLVFVVYFLTYLAANTMSTFCQATGHSEEIPKLISTTVTNVVSCITKDAMLAKIYGTGSGAIPLVTILLFTARDMMTIASSFTAPPKVSKYLQKSHDLPPSVADNVAQLVCPVAVQVVSTPIHLLGLGEHSLFTLYLHPPLLTLYSCSRHRPLQQPHRVRERESRERREHVPQRAERENGPHPSRFWDWRRQQPHYQAKIEELIEARLFHEEEEDEVNRPHK